MNRTEIKETFYRRYGASDNFLHYSFTGAECTLLGNVYAKDAQRLACRLSMGVAMFARRLDGSIIKIQSADSDRVFSYIPGTPPKLFQGREKEIALLLSSFDKRSICGAEILYNSSMPKFIPQKKEFKSSLMKSITQINGIEDFEAEQFKSGYCSVMRGGAARHCPLPLTGYKIVSAYCKARKPANQKSNPLEAGLVYEAVRGLDRCDVKALFYAMNKSCGSGGRDLSFLVKTARLATGVAAAHDNGMCAVMIIDDDCIDYALNAIGTDFENNMGYKAKFCISEAI